MIPTPTTNNLAADIRGFTLIRKKLQQRVKLLLICFFQIRFYPRSSAADVLARVAQLIERWSYKPEVEGLSPSPGTKVAQDG
ncbi:MAG: hypothetical protein QOK48_1978 [Blastocatellia bacterium]|nr:hypothetical protein [Blastocatellia bacterium]